MGTQVAARPSFSATTGAHSTKLRPVGDCFYRLSVGMPWRAGWAAGSVTAAHRGPPGGQKDCTRSNLPFFTARTARPLISVGPWAVALKL